MKLLDSSCIYLKLQLAKGTKQVMVEFDDTTNAVDDEVVLCLIQTMGHNHCRMNISQYKRDGIHHVVELTIF